jgi:hypothetical protein
VALLGLKLLTNNTTASWLNMASKSGVVFITPLLIASNDSRSVEFWFLLLSMNSLILMMDLGLLTNVTRWTAINLRRSDPQALLSLIVRLYLKITVTTVIVSIVISILYFGLYKDLSSFEFAQVIACCIFISISLKNNSTIAFLQGMGFLGLVQMRVALNNILFLLVSAILAFKGFSPFTVFTFLTFASVSNHFNLKQLSNSLGVPYKRVEVKAKNDLGIELAQSSIKTGFGIIVTTVFFNLLPFFLVEFYAGSAIVGVLYALQLVRAVSSFSQAPFYSRIPELSSMKDSKEKEYVDRIRTKYMLFSVAVFLVGICFIYFMNRLGNDIVSLEIQNKLFILISIAMFSERLGNIYLQYLATKEMIIFHITNPLVILSTTFLWFLSGTVVGLLDGIFVSYFVVISVSHFLIAKKGMSSNIYDKLLLIFMLLVWIFLKVGLFTEV